MEEHHPFTCNKCGARGVVLVHEYVEQIHFYESARCECGRASVAAERIYDKYRRYRKVRNVEQERPARNRAEEPELIEEWEEEQRMDDDEFCGDCFATAPLEDWEREEGEPKIRPEEDKHWVYCADCYRKNTTRDDCERDLCP